MRLPPFTRSPHGRRGTAELSEPLSIGRDDAPSEGRVPPRALCRRASPLARPRSVPGRRDARMAPGIGCASGQHVWTIGSDSKLHEAGTKLAHPRHTIIGSVTAGTRECPWGRLGATHPVLSGTAGWRGSGCGATAPRPPCHTRRSGTKRARQPGHADGRTRPSLTQRGPRRRPRASRAPSDASLSRWRSR